MANAMPRTKRRLELELQRQKVELFNLKHPPGTLIDFAPVIGVPGIERRQTRSFAWMVSDHAVVLLSGRSGGCSLDHITVVDPQPVEVPCG